MKGAELTGKKFGRLLVVSQSASVMVGRSWNRAWNCVCDCGETTIVTTAVLTIGEKRSCGCLHTEMVVQKNKQAATHGLHSHRLYPIWRAMMQRCYKPNCEAYPSYGGRGIKVCDLWKDVSKFISDMEPSYSEGLTIGRKDNNGDYCPNNCRWETRIEQGSNKRNNIFIGDLTVAQYARKHGIKYTVAHNVYVQSQ